MSWELSAADRGAGPYVQRFTPFHRLLHTLMFVSFFGLVITGLPLHFASTAWAHVMIQLLGGFQSAGFLHRVCAVVTFGYFGLHVGSLTYQWVTTDRKRDIFWGPNSMVPQPKDVRDVIQMFKWFLGRGPRPQFERYSYMEKFDYWAVFWGVAIIGTSGLLLWFPEFFAKFLPGWAFNIATIVHGDEALLATGFIFTIHFFNVHLRPEKFPIDLVIFTGRATRDYVREEHLLEYQRLADSGELDRLTSAAPSRTLYVWSVVVGFFSLALGLTLVGLVLWAVLS